MSTGNWVIFFLLVSSAASAQTIAVLPLQPHIQARADDATFIERKFHRQLRREGVQLIRGDLVQEALLKAGASDTLSCDTNCLLQIGRELQADRVLAPTLSLQRKEQSAGTVWIWRIRQVLVSAGREWGVFQRMCMCARRTWDRVVERQTRRMLSYDPALRLELPADAPQAAIRQGPREESGMVFVPEGPFVMGHDGGEFDEEPRHRVWLSAYYIDKYEVTNAEYNVCVRSRTCRRQRYWRDAGLNGDQQPVVAVGWDDAVDYCRSVGKRLPTEAEWEKAARGTDERLFPWGNEFHIDWLNMHHDGDGYATTAPVGSFPKNVSPYGAFDMAGNAWEWTADYWKSTYYRQSPDRDPTGPESGVRRVMRGGSWLYDVPFFVTSHNRSPGRPWIRKSAVGFRCAKAL